MAYNGGIDQQVQQKVDAYRSNPGALQQRYKENQQLMDLLALQKIKSEKEQGAREMQMAMENRPETIAQQREQEVLGLTKQELSNKVDQVSGTMGPKTGRTAKKYTACSGWATSRAAYACCS